MLKTFVRRKISCFRMADMRVLMIYRAARFSPNCVEKDRNILEAVGKVLAENGVAVNYVEEENIPADTEADVVFSMGRLPSTLEWIEQKEREGRKVVNGSRGMKNSGRSTIERLVRENDIPVAPLEGNHGYWLKRGDASAQQMGDVVFAEDATKRNLVLANFRKRGIVDVVITAHVVGDLVKFYGVSGTGFFRTFYPTDYGDTKFGCELLNGASSHHYFNLCSLKESAEKLADIVGLQVYGGDCIVRSDGTFAIIDFNDWPSFSRCREEAAVAIASLYNTADAAIREHR
ncbi:MAG: hypothetical protein SOZ80_04510 [Prevotella sp.]|uniref:hypothetical protein n=1 Tax=Prevotella sp. TaxID=59823 RepID=UPI002A3110A0|nr:hypothetical protein [Prevotella sp.]MDD7319155.1 hypothetical protein [Prevotellaceae bacterium]MDY4020023.1 hypothetical protein [Prevotella sp.]